MKHTLDFSNGNCYNVIRKGNEMTKLSQKEWLKLFDDFDPDTKGGNGRHTLRETRVDADGRAISVGVDTRCRGYDIWGKTLEAAEASFAGGGARAFSFEEDGSLSLLVGVESPSDAQPFKSKDLSGSFGKVGTIKRDKWVADYLGVGQRTKRDAATTAFRAVCLGVDRFGYPTAVVCEKTNKRPVYTTEVQITPQDILTFTYGLVRENLEKWGYEGFHKELTAYFTKDLDLVYDAGVPFHHNGGYHGDYFEETETPHPAGCICG